MFVSIENSSLFFVFDFNKISNEVIARNQEEAQVLTSSASESPPELYDRMLGMVKCPIAELTLNHRFQMSLLVINGV